MNLLHREIISYFQNPPALYFHFKGRVSLYLILKAMGIKSGDEIILPAFTCVVVANAIIYLGAKPIYVDINPQTYNIDTNLIESKISTKTKAIIAQNTFGLNANIIEIKAICQKNNLYLIEDCAHGFGGTHEGVPNGTLADAAFFSTQWNKPFSTGLGGFALINNKKLITPFTQASLNLSSPSLKSQLSLLAIFFLKKTILNRWSYWFFLRLFRFLSRHNLILGSSSGEEISGIQIPKNYLQKMGWAQFLIGYLEIRKLKHILSIRKKNGRHYEQILKDRSHHFSWHQDHSFLKYPLLVKDRSTFFELAKTEHINLGDWFLSPLHPITKNFDQWHLNPTDFPHARFAADHIINLPTETKRIDKILLFLKKHSNHIIGDRCVNS